MQISKIWKKSEFSSFRNSLFNFDRDNRLCDVSPDLWVIRSKGCFLFFGVLTVPNYSDLLIGPYSDIVGPCCILTWFSTVMSDLRVCRQCNVTIIGDASSYPCGVFYHSGCIGLAVSKTLLWVWDVVVQNQGLCFLDL